MLVVFGVVCRKYFLVSDIKFVWKSGVVVILFMGL